MAITFEERVFRLLVDGAPPSPALHVHRLPRACALYSSLLLELRRALPVPRSARGLDRRRQPESGQREFACGREHGEVTGSLRQCLPAGCDCDALSPL